MRSLTACKYGHEPSGNLQMTESFYLGILYISQGLRSGDTQAERIIRCYRNHPKSLVLTSSDSSATSRTMRLQVPEMRITFPDSNVVS